MVKKYRLRLPSGDILFKTNDKKLLAEVLEKIKFKVKIEVVFTD